jgi:hypothetical protein
VPPPLDALAVLARVEDASIRDRIAAGDEIESCHFFLFDLLRREQAVAASAQPARSEIARILDLAQAAYGELVGTLIGRDDDLLDSARDGEWSLRDLMRHAIAVELRYSAQVVYAATRADSEPLAIPGDRLPCDRLAPPAAYGDSRRCAIAPMLELLGRARARTDAQTRPLDDHALTRPSLWGEHRMDVRMRLHQVGAHLVEIVMQAEKMVMSDRTTESRRIIRDCCRMRGLHERWSDAGVRADLDTRYARLASSVSG